MTEFRMYEHPVLPERLVKVGVSWPAMLLGPLWLLLKKLWATTAILAAVVGVLYYLNLQGDHPFLARVWCGRYSDYPDLAPYGMAGQFIEGCEDVRSWYEFVILLGATLFCALRGNSLWSFDLVNRGYVLRRSIEARSLDDARAILARESAQFVSTKPGA